MDWPVFKAKNVACQVEGPDLASAVGQELVTPYRTLYHLVDVFRGLGFTVNLASPVIFEFA
jgi:hypothetical protein